jgi:hypothetical protein
LSIDLLINGTVLIFHFENVSLTEECLFCNLIKSTALKFIFYLIFFSLIVFGGTELPIILHFSSAAPQRTAYSEVPSQMAAHLRTGSPL